MFGPLAEVLIPWSWRAFLDKTKLVRSPIRTLARMLHWGLMQWGWAVDHFFLRGWKKSSMRGPIFVLGHQRSGTTVIHRGLSARHGCVGSSLGNMLFPGVFWTRVGRLLAMFDRFFGGVFGRRLLQMQEHTLISLDPIHTIRWHLVEEDEFYFWSLFASAMCANDTEASMASPRLDGLRQPTTWSARARIRIWQWYTQCLQKRAYLASTPKEGGSWVIAKNPAWTWRVEELKAHFPDARFVVLHRDPNAALASRLKLIREIWRLRLGDQSAELPAIAVEKITADSERTFAAQKRLRKEGESPRMLHIDFEDICSDANAVIERIADTWGL